jgi:hypothetical protein
MDLCKELWSIDLFQSGGWYGGRDVLGDGCASYDGGYGAERLAECVEYYLVGTCVAYYL